MSDFNRYKASAKDKKNEDKVNRHINFVVVAYLVILVYLLILIYASFTKDKINYVFAEPGAIVNDGSFTGLLLKDEKVVYSNQAGPINYFVPEGRKVRQASYVCAVNQDPQTSQLIQDKINDHLSQLNDSIDMNTSDYKIIQDRIRDYVLNKHSQNTHLVYDAKDILAATIQDMSQTMYVKNQDLYEQIQQEIAVNQAQLKENGSYYTMPVAGVVSYTFDGLEDVSIDNYNYSDLSRNTEITNVSDNADVSVGDPLFKIIDNHYIYILVEIDPYANKFLQDKYDNGKRYNTLYFPRKNLSIEARIYDIDYDNGKYYAVFELDRYFDDFFDDRYVDFIINYEDYSGIKIPNESVTELDLFQVPSSAVFEEKGNYKIQIEVYSDEDVTHTQLKPVNVKVYYRDDAYAYVRSMDESSLLQVGNQVLYVGDDNNRVSETSIYKLQTPVKVEGVYVLNKGYSDFRRIVTVYKDENFRIVQSGIGYSIGIYDKIASDASEIVEFMTVN